MQVVLATFDNSRGYGQKVCFVGREYLPATLQHISPASLADISLTQLLKGEQV